MPRHYLGIQSLDEYHYCTIEEMTEHPMAT